jgi:hypothetical protein
MSSTVRQVIADRKSVVIAPHPNVNAFVHYDDRRCSDQKRSFDLRRELQLADDSQRLHLNEIQCMISPKSNELETSKTGLLPPFDHSSFQRSS